MFHKTVFQKSNGLFWVKGNNWTEEYPDAFEINEENYLWDDDEEDYEEDFYDEIDDESYTEEERERVQEIFEKNPELEEISAIYALGYDVEHKVTYAREDFIPGENE